eukprot:2540674-Lingulodinium_polyedra.AAC.1
MRVPVFWCPHGVRERAILEPLQRRIVDSIASLCSARKTLRNDALESTIRSRSGLQIARSRAPCGR